MEGERSGGFSNSATVDKARVVDVKPLRTLVPVFPSNGQAPPFVCSPPFGPFPSGFSPFYPFAGATYPTQTNTPNPAPLRSYRGPHVNGDVVGGVDEVEGEEEEENGFVDRQKRPRSAASFQKRHKDVKDFDSMVTMLSDKFVVGISPLQRDDGDREVVVSILMRYDALRRKLNQLEDSMASAGISNRPDLKAGNILMSKGVRTNMRKRIGQVPGVELGDIFFFRMEMCLLGLHAPSMAGIDYMVVKNDSEDEPLAVSIISSGGYEDDAEDPDVLLYTGQGGNAYYKDKPAKDQKLERGNLALERSSRRANQVRVTRGVNIGVASKVYVYDGLFTIQESWVERGKSGCNVFKYKLVRVPRQPPAFATWKSIEKWKDGSSPRVGQILPDLTSGAESIPVSLVNEVDGEKGPAYFTYAPSAKYTKPLKIVGPSFCCNCSKACTPGDPHCSCNEKNEGAFPYTANGVLVSRKPMIYECGPSCACFPNCKSRVSQTGLKVHLEVFRTTNRGWGLRSWDPIRAGSFICEYAGEVIEKSSGDEGVKNDYVFDTTHVYEVFKWNCEPGIIDEEGCDTVEEYSIPSPILINAGNVGNVARFMNHSCCPNVFWQPIMYTESDEPVLCVAFFARRHIPPMMELTYDYGVSQNNMARGKKKCLCGSPKCRGSFW